MANRSRSPSRPAASRAPDAITLLRADHQRVAELFEQFEKTRSSHRKRSIADTICQELGVHAQIEEEIFYPAFKEAMRDKELVPEARVEHATLRALIGQVQAMAPEGEEFDAHVKVMAEYVRHHVKEEQGEMFKKAKASAKLDLKALGQALLERRQALMAEWEAGGAEAPARETPAELVSQSDD